MTPIAVLRAIQAFFGGLIRRIRAALTVSVVIAACALWLTFHQIREANYIAKIQTVPNLNLQSFVDEVGKAGCGKIPARKATANSKTLCLQNSGLGPARLVGIDVVFDGQIVPTPMGIQWGAYSKNLFGIGVDLRLLETTDIPPTLTVPAGEVIPLVRWQTPPSPTSPYGVSLDQLIQNGRFGIGVCFCNYYNDCFYVRTPGRWENRNPRDSCKYSPAFLREPDWFERALDKSLVQ